jgi:hypothetical protein
MLCCDRDSCDHLFYEQELNNIIFEYQIFHQLLFSRVHQPRGLRLFVLQEVSSALEKSLYYTMSTEIPEKIAPEEIAWYDALRKLLSIYEPAAESEAEKYFSTSEIVAALEQHFGYEQGDPEVRFVDGKLLVEQLHGLGYDTVNIGGLGLQWMMKKK